MKLLLKILLFCAVLGAGPQALAVMLDFHNHEGRGGEPGMAEDRAESTLVITDSNGPTLSEAVEMVRRRYKGRIVSAETKMRGNREVHHIKVLTEDGKVKTVQIQGRSREP